MTKFEDVRRRYWSGRDPKSCLVPTMASADYVVLFERIEELEEELSSVPCKPKTPRKSTAKPRGKPGPKPRAKNTEKGIEGG